MAVAYSPIPNEDVPEVPEIPKHQTKEAIDDLAD